MNKLTRRLAWVCASLALALPVQADSINSLLFNTGVDGSHAFLANGTTPDPHYTLTTVPASSTTATRVVTGAWPAGGGGPYFDPLGAVNPSLWIVANNGSPGSFTSPPGTYTFRTTFDLTGYDPSTASISGKWSSDNNGLDILLNGSSICSPPGCTTSFEQFSSGFVTFLVAAGFVAGVNTLDFVISNGAGTSGNPVGLRVELTGTAAPVPLPPAALLLISGLIGLAALRRRSVATA